MVEIVSVVTVGVVEVTVILEMERVLTMLQDDLLMVIAEEGW